MNFRGKKSWVHKSKVNLLIVDIMYNVELISEIYQKVLNFLRDHKVLKKYSCVVTSGKHLHKLRIPSTFKLLYRRNRNSKVQNTNSQVSMDLNCEMNIICKWWW